MKKFISVFSLQFLFLLFISTNALAQESLRSQIISAYPELPAAEIDFVESIFTIQNITPTDPEAAEFIDEIMRMTDASATDINAQPFPSIQSAEVLMVSDSEMTIGLSFAAGEAEVSGLRYYFDFFKWSETETETEVAVRKHVSKPFDVSSLTMGENVTAEVIVPVPTDLAGTYSIVAVLGEVTSGRTFTTIPVGDVVVPGSGVGISILEEECYLTVLDEINSPQYNLTQGVDIQPDETLQLNCVVTNTTDSQQVVSPRFSIYERSLFGKIVDTDNSDTTITLAPSSTQAISFLLPKQTKAQSYRLLIDLVATTSNQTSSAITAHYVLRGNSATIQGLDTDKTSLEAGEEAQLTLSYTGRADAFPDTRINAAESEQPLFGTVALFSSDGVACGSPLRQQLNTETPLNTQGFSYQVAEKCESITVAVSIDDDAGNVLSSASFDFITPSVSPEVPNEVSTANNELSLLNKLLLALGLLSTLVLLAVWLVRGRNKKISQVMSMLIVGGVGVCGLLLASPATVEAQWTQSYFSLDRAVPGGDYRMSGYFSHPPSGTTHPYGVPYAIFGDITYAACNNAYVASVWEFRVYDQTTYQLVNLRRGGGGNYTNERFYLPPGRYFFHMQWWDYRFKSETRQSRYAFNITVSPPPSPPRNCSVNGVTVPHGSSRNFYGFTSSTNCSWYASRRYCNDGTLSGSSWYQYSSCSAPPPPPRNCFLDGVTVAHGTSRTFYGLTSSTNCSLYDGSRYCNNGTLSGNSWYQYSSCSTVPPPPPPPPPSNCSLNGVTVPHGSSRAFYDRTSSTNCASQDQTRSCNNGTLSGNASYQYSSCSQAPETWQQTCSGSPDWRWNESSSYGNTRDGGSCAPEIVLNIQSSSQLVRNGTPATISWEIESPYAVSCTTLGLQDQTINHSGTPESSSGSFETSDLTAEQDVSISCDSEEPGLSPQVTRNMTIEVTPQQQEI